MCGDSLGKNIQILFLLSGIDLAGLKGIPDGIRQIRRDDDSRKDSVQDSAVEPGIAPCLITEEVYRVGAELQSSALADIGVLIFQ